MDRRWFVYSCINLLSKTLRASPAGTFACFQQRGGVQRLIFCPHCFFHVGGDEFADVAAVAGSLLDHGRGQVAPADAGGQEHRLDAGHQGVVGLRQLDLVLKIGDRPQPPHHDGGVALARKIDGQAVEALHRDVGDVLAALLQQGHPLLDGEQRLFGAVDEHRHDQTVVDLGRPLDDIQMAPCDRIKRAGVNGDCHGNCLPVLGAEPLGAALRPV